MKPLPFPPRAGAAGFTAPPALKAGEERRKLKRRDPEDRDAAVRRAESEPWWPAVTGSRHPAFARGYWLWTVATARLPRITTEDHHAK